MKSIAKTSSLIRRLFASVVLLTVLLPLPAAAVSQQIRAVFKPNPASPQFNEFENRTPVSGFCLDNPPQCKAEGMFSLRLPIKSYSNATIRAGHSNQRMGAMFNIPSQWRPITVTHLNGASQTVMFRVAGMGVAYKLPKPATELTDGAGHNFLWESGSWSYPTAPCVGLLGAGNDLGFNSFWRHPINTGVCRKRAMFDIPEPFIYETFDFTYELKTPDPLQMYSGQYVGQHVMRVGPGLDFDLGDVMVPADDLITLDFALDVEHELKVEVPPGGNKVQLIPEGGWQSWLQAGRKPVRLYRDQMFNISASSRFKMYLQCSITDGRVCMLTDEGRRLLVPMKVSVSLPPGLTDAAGRPVHRQELLTQTGAVTFRPGLYVDRQPGLLHFEVERFDYLLAPGMPRRYLGNVTVVWDSEV